MTITSAALLHYQQAADLDIDDYRAPWNTSAVYFEIGEYLLVVDYVENAKALAKDQIIRQKILSRQSKAFLHLRERYEAEKLIDELQSDEAKKMFETALAAARRTPEEASTGRNVRSLRGSTTLLVTTIPTQCWIRSF